MENANLILLWKSEIMRYSELKRSLEGITHKMLSNQLKELENDRLIIRTEYPQVPPKEYKLSERGKHSCRYYILSVTGD